MVNAGLHKLTQWLSPSYPVGSFSYSHGLEWVISEGEITDAAALKTWLLDILNHGAGRNDAILLAHAYRAETPSELAEVSELATAFNPSAERLLETQSQGAAFAKTTRSIWPAELSDMPYPVAVGAAARQHAIPLDDTIALYLHSFAANLVSAAVRFVPLGQTEGQRVLSELFEAIDKITFETQVSTLDDLGGCAFRADIASMKHETQTTRIFRS
ncbi:urease accessory protein UreF [Rhodobacterales bacterium 52_120_T64]|nr:urease accessory protein UreF [Rhodobacterales bacterium 52_120_T64]